MLQTLKRICFPLWISLNFSPKPQWFKIVSLSPGEGKSMERDQLQSKNNKCLSLFENIFFSKAHFELKEKKKGSLCTKYFILRI